MSFSFLMEPVVYLLAFGVVVGAGAILWFLIDHRGWRGRVDADRTAFKNFMAEVRADIKKILGRLPRTVAEQQSPLRLNDLGHAVSEAINAREWADRIIPDVAERLEGSEAFEVEDFCFVYVGHTMEYSEEENRVIKRAAYENGLADEEVKRVLAIELRDKLLTRAGLEAP